MEQVGISVLEHSQQKGIKPKMRRCKSRSGVYWQEVLKQKDIKQVEGETRGMYTMFWGPDRSYKTVT